MNSVGFKGVVMVALASLSPGRMNCCMASDRDRSSSGILRILQGSLCRSKGSNTIISKVLPRKLQNVWLGRLAREVYLKKVQGYEDQISHRAVFHTRSPPVVV